MARVWMPLPDIDFDPGEAAVPWRTLVRAGHEVVFASEGGASGPAPQADPRLMSGVLFGRLGASADAKEAYAEMRASSAFAARQRWDEIDPFAFDGLLLPGGHAKGMRQYLESVPLREKGGAFFRSGRPVGAICHGVLVLARARDPETGRSVLHGRTTTCLPRYMELLAYYSTAWKLGSYYRTYPVTVEAEVRAALSSPASFRRGPILLGEPATAKDDDTAFVVEDGAYVSARWPGDAPLFGRRFLAALTRERPVS
jgi:putative intracellular protease/amidase